MKWDGGVASHEKQDKQWKRAAHHALTVTTIVQGQRVHQNTARFV